jgi:3-phenylpropionate/trans-cinnamate dioxygenase ferredoxin subunit
MEDSEFEFFAVLQENELKDGSMRLVKAEGLPILFIRVSGQIFAIDNRCPHLGCGFSGGTLEGSTIVCPCHEWRFDLRTGAYEADNEFVLVKYECKVEAGKIWVKLEV